MPYLIILLIALTACAPIDLLSPEPALEAATREAAAEWCAASDEEYCPTIADGGTAIRSSALPGEVCAEWRESVIGNAAEIVIDPTACAGVYVLDESVRHTDAAVHAPDWAEGTVWRIATRHEIDVRLIAHELGHLVGIEHQQGPAAMCSHTDFLSEITPADISALRAVD